MEHLFFKIKISVLGLLVQPFFFVGALHSLPAPAPIPVIPSTVQPFVVRCPGCMMLLYASLSALSDLPKIPFYPRYIHFPSCPSAQRPLLEALPTTLTSLMFGCPLAPLWCSVLNFIKPLFRLETLLIFLPLLLHNL